MRRRNAWLVVSIAIVALWGGKVWRSESGESGAVKKQARHASNPVAQEPEFAGSARAIAEQVEGRSLTRAPRGQETFQRSAQSSLATS